MTSKQLPPRTESFFPTILCKTQFCERQAGLPPGLDLKSQVAIVTGANAGLGFESCKQLLSLNLSHLILGVCTINKREKAADQPSQPILKSLDDSSKFSNTTWYDTSKTLMHLFLWKLEEFVPAESVIVNIVDPGYVKGIESVSKMPIPTAMMAKSSAVITGRTVEVGASTYIDAVAVKGGKKAIVAS